MTDWITRFLTVVHPTAGGVVAILGWLKSVVVKSPEQKRADLAEAQQKNAMDALMLSLHTLQTLAEGQQQLSAPLMLLDDSKPRLPAQIPRDNSLTASDLRVLSRWERTLRQFGTGLLREKIGAYLHTGRPGVGASSLFLSLEALGAYAARTADDHAILIVSNCVGFHERATNYFYQVMREAAEIVAMGGARRLSDVPASDFTRVLPPLTIATDLFKPGTVLEDRELHLLHDLLAALPTICVQAHADPSTIQTWWWTPGEPGLKAADYQVRFSPHEMTERQAHIADTAQVLTVVLSDMLSLSSFEGADALPRAVRASGAASEPMQELYERFRTVYADMYRTYRPRYGELGLAEGMPTIQPTKPDPALVNQLHLALLNRQYEYDKTRDGTLPPSCTGMDDWTFVPIADVSEDVLGPTRHPVYVLAAQARANGCAQISCYLTANLQYRPQGWGPGSEMWRTALEEGLRTFVSDPQSFVDLGVVNLAPRNTPLRAHITSRLHAAK